MSTKLSVVGLKTSMRLAVGGGLKTTSRRRVQVSTGSVGPFILLENGGYLLLQSGDKIIAVTMEFLGLESGGYILLESGDRISLD